MKAKEFNETICNILAYNDFEKLEEIIEFAYNTLKIDKGLIINRIADLVAFKTIQKDKNGFYRCV